MEKSNELIQVIANQISEIDENLSTLSIKNEQILEQYKSLIEQNIQKKEFYYLKEFNIEELTSILPQNFTQDLQTLKFYITALNTSYINIMHSQLEIIEDIKRILTNIYNYLKEQIKINNKNKVIIESSNNRKNSLKNLTGKISGTGELNESDITNIFEILNTLDDKNKAIDLLIAFGESILTEQNTVKNTKEESETVVENENQEQIKEQLIEIFKYHDLDFYWLKERDQTSLIKYSNPNNINEILNVFKEFNINLGDKCSNGINGRLLEDKSLAITEIFLLSTTEMVKKILESAKKNSEKINIEHLIKRPEIFIKKKRRYYRKGTITVSTGENNKSKIIGCHDDFIKNLQFFTNLGISVKEFLKHKKVPQASHEKILNNQKIFELYGIDKYHYLRSLSCFEVSSQPADTIDQYIELGCFDYFIDNMSISNLGPESLDCYRILYALKYTNLNPTQIFRIRNESKGQKLVLNNNYVNTNNNIATMTPENCYKMLNKHIPFSEIDNTSELYYKFEEAISKSDNSSVDIALGRNNSIITLLDDFYLVKNEDNTPVFPEIYNFGTVPVKVDGQENLYKDWNIIISRKKVLRIYNTLMQQGIAGSIESIVYAITRNSILTKEEYDIIYNIIIDLNRKRSLI